MNLPTPPLKPGVSTTEFWVVIIGGLLLTAQAALSLTSVTWAAGGVTLLGLLYVHQRGRLKSQESIKAMELHRREQDKPQ